MKALSRAELADWKSFISDVIMVENDQGNVSGARRRLEERTASGLGEAVPADGGFLVQPQWANQLIMRSYQESAVMSRMNQWDIDDNNHDGLKIPALDETSRKEGSRWGGVRSRWANEADDLTNLNSQFKFRNVELNPSKIVITVPLTSELLRDLGSLAQFLFNNVLPREIAFRVVDAAINGDGNGKPMGIVNSPGKVKVSAENNQQTGTIVSENIINMLSRFWAGSYQQTTPTDVDVRKSSAWFCHTNVFAKLPSLTLLAGSGGSVSRLFDPNTMVMMGFPVFVIEQCQDIGTEGDIVLGDFSQYELGFRSRGDLQISMHVKFLTDEQVIRLTVRVDGQPSWQTPVTPLYGSTTQSPFVTLAAR